MAAPTAVWDKAKELAIAQKILQKFHCAPCDPPGQCPNLTQNAWGADVKPMGKKTARCYGFHDAKKRADRRRVPFGSDGRLRYWADPCPKWRTAGKCSDGDNCLYSHTDVEQLYHPSKYKTTDCEGKKCWGDVCAFIHKPAESRHRFAQMYLRPTAIQEAPPQLILKENWWVDYKTRPCMVPNCSRGRYCMDAHPGERRRHPYREEGRLVYEPAQAENELEFYYHPEIYRREFCPSLRKANTPCSHDRLCHRAHSMEEFFGRFYHPQQTIMPQAFSDIAEFMVLRWKTMSCPWLHWPHIWARCPYHHRFHNQNMSSLMKPDLDWRRVLYNDKGMINYWPEPCPIASEGRSCPNGIACENTHTKAEFMYHPEKYRRRECQYGGRNCPRSIYCAFIHPGDLIGASCTAAQLQLITLEFNFEDVTDGPGNSLTDSGGELHEPPASDDALRSSLSAPIPAAASSLSSSMTWAAATTPPLALEEADEDQAEDMPEANGLAPPASLSVSAVTPPLTHSSPVLPLAHAAEHLAHLVSEMQSLPLIPWNALHFPLEDLNRATPGMTSERALLIGAGYVMLHTKSPPLGGFTAAAQQLRRLDKLNAAALVNGVAHLGFTVLPRRLDRSELPEVALVTEFFPHSETLGNALHGTASLYNPGSSRYATFCRVQDEAQRWINRTSIARQVIAGVSRLHELQFFVGNLRTTNILIALNWEKSPVCNLKISDLGSVDPAPLAPELKSSEQATATGDVYNFGILLQELLTLARPLDAKGARDDRALAAFVQSGASVLANEWADLVRQCCTVQATRRPTILAVERTVARLAEQEAAQFAEAAETAKAAVQLHNATVPRNLRAPKRKTTRAAAVPQPAPAPGTVYEVVQAPVSGKAKGGK